MAKSNRFRIQHGVFGILTALLLQAGVSVPAFAQEVHRFQINTTDAAAAIHEFGNQSGVQILASAEALRGKRLNEVSGDLSTDDGLHRLLADTGLSHRYVGERAVALVSDSPAPGSDSSRTPSAPHAFNNPETPNTGTAKRPSFWDRFRLAQNESSLQTDSASSKAEKGEPVVAMPEILVIGSKSLNTDIRRTRDDTQPYVVFGAEEIQRTQALTLEDFFKMRLTMNSQQVSLRQTTAGTGARSTISLRGLSSDQTLILLNGRRTPSLSGGNAFIQSDVNAVPLGTIERIEVLPATASGIYGGGATGGVVNIITRRDFDGLELTASYDNTSRWDMSNRRLSLAAGASLENTRLLFSASHSEAESLLSGERPFTYEGRLLRDANNPVAGLPSPLLGYTTNICAAASATATTCSSAPLVLRNGTALGSNRTFVPVGYSGSDGGAALAANAGRYNLDLPDDLSGARRSVLSSPTLDSAFASLRREFTPKLEAFVDLSWYRNQGQSFSTSLPTTATISANAPNNPFTSPILVSFPSPGLSYTVDGLIESSMAIGGVILRLPRGWTAETDYAWGRSSLSSVQTFPALRSTFNAAVASGAVNVLRDLNAFPLDYSPYLLSSPNTFLPAARLTLRDLSLRLSGPALDLPAGAMTLTSLLEHRDESSDEVLQENGDASGVPRQFYSPPRSQTVNSLYVEARAPLFSAALATRPFLRELDLQASIRRDEYRTDAPSPSILTAPPFTAFVGQTNRAESTDYMAGLRYAPFETLTLRASHGTGFLPPSVSQISPQAPFSQTAAGAAVLRDPRRGGALGSVVPYTILSGGDPGLRPEKSKSLSVGAILTPPALPGFRLSLDYVRIEKSDEIRNLTAQVILDLEDIFPSRVTRAPLTAADMALGYTGGLITAIDTSLINAASTRLHAYDVQVDYSFKTQRFGDFHMYATGTRQPSFTVTPAPSVTDFDTVGFDQGVLEWRANAGITWKYGGWAVGWNAQYLDPYKVYGATANDATRAAAVLDQGSDTIRSQTYHDLSVGYRFHGASSKGGDFLADSEILFGIQNVLDTQPPIIAVTSPIFGGYSTHADPRLRRFTLSVRKRW